MRKLKKPVKRPATVDGESKLKRSKRKIQEEQRENGFPLTDAVQNELKYLRYTLSEKYCNERQLFLKKNSASSNALLVANIPSFLDIFTSTNIGGVSNLKSSSLDGSLDIGQITLTLELDSAEAVETVLNKCQSAGPYRASDFGFVLPENFLKKEISKYQEMFMDADSLQEKVNIYMQHHDQQVLEAKSATKRKYTEPDEEGWITVTKASKKVAKMQKLKKKDIPLTGGLNRKKKTESVSFYPFHVKESKVKKSSELQAKFAEDRKRIEQLKKSRHFNPL